MAPKAAPPGLVGSLGLLCSFTVSGYNTESTFLPGCRGRRPQISIFSLRTLLVGAGIVWAAIHLPSTRQLRRRDVCRLRHQYGNTAGRHGSRRRRKPAIGYSVGYPFGVIGPILCMYIAILLIKPQIEAPSGTGLELIEGRGAQPRKSARPSASLVECCRRGSG